MATQKEPMTEYNQIPLDPESDLAKEIDEAAKASRFVFEPGWNTPEVQKKYQD